MPVPPSTTHAALVGAIDDMVRAQREAGAWLSRQLDCSRASLAVVRVLDRGPRPVGDLALALRVDVSVTSRQVAGLVDAGLVERGVDAGDRRVRTVSLTDAGRALATRHAATARDLAAQVFAGWSDDEVAAAAEQLRRVAGAVMRHHDEHAGHDAATESDHAPDAGEATTSTTTAAPHHSTDRRYA